VVLSDEPGKKILLLRGTRLPGKQEEYIIVFDDITSMIQVQRDAAWSEVARRLAHEIKNPLTPIQLSAERIRHKCMDELKPESRETLDRSTRTIVEQVDSLKEMINAFSNYARPARARLEELDLNELVRDVVELYKSHPDSNSKIDIQLELASEMQNIHADRGRLRQVLHNLLLNSQEALTETRHPVIRISTQSSGTDNDATVEIIVADNGPGFPKQLMDNLFEPYVTNKAKGTGLGLAIVKKIAEEHNGSLIAANLKQGAEVRIILPIRAGADNSNTAREKRA